MIEIVTNVTLKKDHTFILERQSDISSKNLSRTSFKFVRALYLFYIYFHTYVHTHFLVLGFVILKNLLFFFFKYVLKKLMYLSQYYLRVHKAEITDHRIAGN